MITRLVEATIVAKLEANSRLVKADVAVNVRVAIAEIFELAAVTCTMFTRFKTKVTPLGQDFDTED